MKFLPDFQQYHDVAEIGTGNHSATGSLVAQNYTPHIKKLLCYNAIILTIKQSAITRLQKYLKSFRGVKLDFSASIVCSF